MPTSMLAAVPGAAPSPRAHTILIDEDAPARAFLAENLTADGYVVFAAHDRDRGLALLSSTRADVVIVDVNGQTLGLLDTVRGADGLASRIDPDTPLITLTGRAGELHRIRALDRGADDVIAKPFSDPGGCSPRRSCCATCGGSRLMTRPARSTATPAGCVASSNSPAGSGSWSRSGGLAIA